MKKKTKYVVLFILTIIFYTYIITQLITDIDLNLTRLVYGSLFQAFIAIYFFPSPKKKKEK